MSTNRRRRLENTVPVGAYSPWFLIAILALLGGLTWVYYRNQLVNRGQMIGAKEKDLAGFVRKNEDLKSRIAQLSTYAALQKCCNDGTIKMIRITPGSVVHVDFPHRAGGSEIRAVSNEGARR
ncbi:MAG: hypothetical protein PHQ12_09620 [Chthoniobacteraceae bacterium]|nr:hypothetical protein [Chthoniobacteraceae bacterium]